jgi:hypothetical protein
MQDYAGTFTSKDHEKNEKLRIMQELAALED